MALRRHWLPDYLVNVTTLAVVLVAFVGATLLMDEAGLLAVTVMGLWLANMPGVDVEEILDFKETLSVLLISFLFILLSARIQLQEFMALGWGGVGVFLAIQFLSRPLSVMLSALGSPLAWAERHLLAWIAPRGIVAAAVSALFALRLEGLGVDGARLLVPLTFLVIVGTVVLQSLTARPLARLLGVAEPEPHGFLIVGAGRVARAVAEPLAGVGVRVVLAEANWENIRRARMAGLETYYGNPLSAHAERHLDLVGIGAMLGLSATERQNQLAAMHFRQVLGERQVYLLRTRTDGEGGHRRAGRVRVRHLFGPQWTYSRINDILAAGGAIRATPLSDRFDFDAYLAANPGAVPLFAVHPAGRILPFTDEDRPRPGDGWRLIALVPPADAGRQQNVG